MKRQLERTIDDLKADIKLIAKDTKLSDAQKIERIIGAGEPSPALKFKALEFGVEPELWNALKKNDEFWVSVARIMDIAYYGRLDQEGRSTFGVSEVSNVMGVDWFYQLGKLINFDSLSEIEQRRRARSEFVSYMQWFDSEASIDFLTFYARYLRIKGLLPSIDFTKQHIKAVKPLFKSTTIPSTPVPKKTIPVVVEQLPPLGLAEETRFYINTTIRIVLPLESHQFFLQMKKEAEGKAETRLFTVRLENLEHNIPTQGLITRVLKFVTENELYIVISGESDNTLIRVQYNKRDFPFTLDTKFPPLNPDLFDDLIYYDLKHPSRYATNVKSVNSLDQLMLFDVGVLGGLITRRVERKDLTKEELVIHLKYENLDRKSAAFNRPLEKEERDALLKRRLSRGENTSGIDTMTRAQLTDDEVAYVRREIGYIDLETMKKTKISDYSTLWVPIVKPLVPIFRPTRIQAIYAKDEVELVAAKVIRVPQEVFKTFFTLAVLARKYTAWGVDKFITQLYLFRYVKTDDSYRVDRPHVIDVENFLLPPHIPELGVVVWRTVKELNLIFHDKNFFYIEAMQEGLSEQRQSIMRNSPVLEFNFLYSPFKALSGLSPENTIKDFAILNTLASNGYKMYDFRHDIAEGHESKFDALFYKYNYENGKARLIVYKARSERAGIADLLVEKLSPRRIIAISPMQSMNLLAFIQIKVPKGEKGLYRLIGKEALLTYDPATFSLASQLQSSLTVSSLNMQEEVASCCAFCAEYTSNDDQKTGYYYCDALCQLLFCTTNRL